MQGHRQYSPYTVGYFRADLSVSDPKEQQKLKMRQGIVERVETIEAKTETNETPATTAATASTPTTQTQDSQKLSPDLLEIRLLVSEDRTMQREGCSTPLHSIIVEVAREELDTVAERLQKKGQDIARQYHALDTTIAEARRLVYDVCRTGNHGQRWRPLVLGELRASFPKRELIDDALNIWNRISAQSRITTHNHPHLYQNLQRLETECAAYDATLTQRTRAPAESPKQIPSIISVWTHPS